MPSIKNMKFGTKLGLLVAIFLIGFLIFGGLALVGLDRVQVNGPIYTQIIHGKDLIADILPPPEYIIETHLTSLEMLISLENGTQESSLPALISKEAHLKEEFNTRHAFWDTTLASGALRTEMIETAYQPAVQYYTVMEDLYIPALKAKDLTKAKAILNESLIPLYNQHRKSVDKINELATAANNDLETTTAKEIQTLWLTLAVVSIVVVVASILFSVIISMGIVKPVRQMVETARQIAKGNLAQKVELRSNDEIGQLAEAFRAMIQYLDQIAGTARKIADNDLSNNVTPYSNQDVLGIAFREMTKNLRMMVGQVQTGVDTLAGASSQLSSKANSVALSAEEMSMNSVSAAAGMEQAATNLRSVATATEEMTATINDIAGNSEKARQITGDAVRQADRISVTMHSLGDAAQDIGKITETITAISKQTNLLALNATIESARAGANGRGFAVVASEIKALAVQTSSATEDIKSKISSVQDSTSMMVNEISEIIAVFDEVSSIVTTIATAIEEQSMVTRDIASNINQATIGVVESNQRVSNTAAIVQNVAHDIAGGNQSRQMGKDTNVLDSAQELAQLAGQLRLLVGQFTT